MNDTDRKKQFVVDASVAVKWLSSSDENNVGEADLLLASVRRGNVILFAPDLLLYEVLNALLKGKKLMERDMEAALDVLQNIELTLRQPDEQMSRLSVKFARAHNITIYDAAYFALASMLDIPLISANPKHHRTQKDIAVIPLKELRKHIRRGG